MEWGAVPGGWVGSRVACCTGHAPESPGEGGTRALCGLSCRLVISQVWGYTGVPSEPPGLVPAAEAGWVVQV